MSDDLKVAYFAVHRADSRDPNPDSYTQICVGLFTDVEDVLRETKRLLEDGDHVIVEHGVMSLSEWDALEEVPDDFTPATVETRPH